MFPAADPQGLFTQKLFNSNVDDFSITGLSNEKKTYKNSVIHHTFCFKSTNVEKSETAIGIFILSDFLISLISFEVYELYSADFPTARQHPRVATLLNQHFKHHQRAAPSSNPKISKQRGCNNWSTQCQISTITTGHKVIQQARLTNAGDMRETDSGCQKRIPESSLP